MATIEPRLMHLLNVNDSRAHLPSIHSTLGAPRAAEDGVDLLLPPLEFNSSEATSPTSPASYQHQHQHPQHPLHPLHHHHPVPLHDEANGPSTARLHRLPGSDVSLPDLASLSGSFDDLLPGTGTSAATAGKRPRVLPYTDDLIQLPQPLKKQKSNQQVGPLSQVFPPIINGLHEPPPNAAVFPPIASDFDANDGLSRGPVSLDHAGGSFTTAYDGTLSSLMALPSTEIDRSADAATSTSTSTTPAPVSILPPSSMVLPAETSGGEGASRSSKSPSTARPKRRATKPRRRWSEEETNQLLIGVSRHGLGKWTAILEDAEFSFCHRSAGDLKDRFRTCCPEELRGNLGREGTATATTTAALLDSSAKRDAAASAKTMQLKSKTSLSLEDILIEPEDSCDVPGQPSRYPDASGEASPSATAGSGPPKLRKRRVHRRNMEDMVKLGIQGPFKKSHRRERRPFTEQDDREILQGLQIYGPAWTKIHRHPSYNLSSRQPTDLRDRVRNKYPDVYAKIEKGAFQPQTHGSSASGGGSGSGSGGSAAKHARNRSSSGSNSNTLLEPSASTAIENALSCVTTNTSTGTNTGPDPTPSASHVTPTLLHPSREDLPSRNLLPSLSRADFSGSHDSSVFDISEASSTSFLGNVGEMGISRLLLDDPQIPSYPL